MFKFLGPLLTLINKVWDSVASLIRKNKHEKLIDDIESGRLADARKRFNDRMREKAADKTK